MRFLRPAILILSIPPMLAPAWAVTPLAPHRAVYDLTLDTASERSGITDISGRMVYEFGGSPCEGYTVNFRFVTQIDTRDTSRVTDQQTTTYEAPGGKDFTFLSKSFVDQQKEKQTRGEARIEDGKTIVEIAEPEPVTVDLPASQFPTAHLYEMLDKARAGQSFYETSIYDGSDDADEVMTTSVVLGKPAKPDKGSPEFTALGRIAQDSFWPVEIAYFSKESQAGEQTPKYRISFRLHENGVTRDLMMDYGDFSIKGRLVELSLLNPSKKDCDATR
jgi:hypothetical protein